MREISLEKVVGYVSEHHKDKLIYHSYNFKIPITRLVALAIDNELAKEIPFDNLLIDLPELHDSVEFAYADQAGKILKFMAGQRGFSLDQIITLRFDIGVPDRTELIYALKECIDKGFLEAFKPTPNRYSKTEYSDEYVHYRLKSEGTPEKRRIRREANEYSKFQRLKRKYENK